MDKLSFLEELEIPEKEGQKTSRAYLMVADLNNAGDKKLADAVRKVANAKNLKDSQICKLIVANSLFEKKEYDELVKQILA